MVLEGLSPTVSGISRYIEGKSREISVKTSDMASARDVLCRLHAAIYENDIITKDQRVQLVERVEAAVKDLEVDPTGKNGSVWTWLSELARGPLAPIAITASLLGAMVALVPKLFSGSGVGVSETDTKTLLLQASAIFIASIFTVIMFFTIRRSREVTIDTPVIDISAPSPEVMFFREVRQVLKLFGLDYAPGPEGVDLAVVINGKTIIIETRVAQAPNAAAASRLLSRAFERLSRGVSTVGVSEGLLVVKSEADLTEIKTPSPLIKLLTLEQFKSYVGARLQDEPG